MPTAYVFVKDIHLCKSFTPRALQLCEDITINKTLKHAGIRLIVLDEITVYFIPLGVRCSGRTVIRISRGPSLAEVNCHFLPIFDTEIGILKLLCSSCPILSATVDIYNIYNNEKIFLVS